MPCCREFEMFKACLERMKVRALLQFWCAPPKHVYNEVPGMSEFAL